MVAKAAPNAPNIGTSVTPAMIMVMSEARLVSGTVRVSLPSSMPVAVIGANAWADRISASAHTNAAAGWNTAGVIRRSASGPQSEIPNHK